MWFFIQSEGVEKKSKETDPPFPLRFLLNSKYLTHNKWTHSHVLAGEERVSVRSLMCCPDVCYVCLGEGLGEKPLDWGWEQDWRHPLRLPSGPSSAGWQILFFRESLSNVEGFEALQGELFLKKASRSHLKISLWLLACMYPLQWVT